MIAGVTLRDVTHFRRVRPLRNRFVMADDLTNN